MKLRKRSLGRREEPGEEGVKQLRGGCFGEGVLTSKGLREEGRKEDTSQVLAACGCMGDLTKITFKLEVPMEAKK